MKKVIFSLFIALLTISGMAQEVSTISLEQTPGAFTVQELTINQGEYVFEVKNNGVDHQVGLVLVPAGKSDQSDHIKNAYLKSTPDNGQKAQSNVVNLKKGTYEYFCPMNPTPRYKLTVI